MQNQGYNNQGYNNQGYQGGYQPPQNNTNVTPIIINNQWRSRKNKRINS